MDGNGRILVVEDEPYLADLVITALRYEGYTVAVAGTGQEAMTGVERFRPDLLVLDVLLPDDSGLEICQRLRRSGFDAPVVFLTARDATEDKIAGLRAGGDDYITKPFRLEELVLRIRAVLRRTHSGARSPAVLGFADLSLNEDLHEVRRGGKLVDLTPTEFKLLRYLLVNAEQVLTKRQILGHVWEYDFNGNDGVVQTYISYLRRKIDGNGEPLIHTVPRVGYILRTPRQDG
ncbi:response regulator transcription factor [Amycolatopsis thailandensis]|uniref:response regulator transcription factor n=1 Tax=Amycolatopsis thailandensis TaxID=589330 RepID=UPI00364B69E4